MNPSDYVKRTPLTTFSFFFMVIALTVMGLAYSHIFGINILSRIIPSIPEPQQISLYPRFFVLINAFVPMIILLSSIGLILISLRDVLAEKCHYGIRPEIALIANSLVVMIFTLLLLASRIQPASSINDALVSIGFILALLGLGIFAIAFLHKYISGKK